MVLIDKPKLKIGANAGTIFSTILGIVSFYFIPQNLKTSIIITLVILIISLAFSIHEYSKEVKSYLEFIGEKTTKNSILIKGQQEKIVELSQKHKALSEQFTKKSEKLDQANYYFEILATFLTQSLSLTAPPYTKKQENERYKSLLKLIIDFRNDSKEE